MVFVRKLTGFRIGFWDAGADDDNDWLRYGPDGQPGYANYDDDGDWDPYGPDGAPGLINVDDDGDWDPKGPADGSVFWESFCGYCGKPAYTPFYKHCGREV